MNILVTGGTGYIGSHTCVELLNNNHSVIIADNLINSKIETIDKIKVVSRILCKRFGFSFHKLCCRNNFLIRIQTY